MRRALLDAIAARQRIGHEVAAWSVPPVGPSDQAVGSRLLTDQREARAAAVARLFAPQTDEHDDE